MKPILPEEVALSFQKKGINPQETILTMKTDMGREEFFCDAYTLLTRDGITALFCLSALTENKGASFFSRHKSAPAFHKLDDCHFPLSDIERLKAEEMVSVIRLVVTLKSGEDIVLLYATGACRKDVYRFVESVNTYLTEGRLPEEKKDAPTDRLCPICHRPLDDPQRRVCRHCAKKRNYLKKLLPFFLRYKGKIALVLLTVVLSGLVAVLTPYLNNKVLYDEVLSPTSARYGKILALVVSVAAAALIEAVIRMVNAIIGAHVSAAVTYDLKKTIFSSFERLSYSFFISRHTGKLITQINTDAETLYWFFCDGVPYFITNILQMLGIAIVMLTIHPALSAVVLLPVPLLFLGYLLVLRMFRRLHAENHNHRSRFNGVLSDVLGGMRIVKAFSRESQEIARFDVNSRALSASKLSIDLRRNTVFPLLNLGMRLSTYLVWGVGGYFVLKETALPGSGISYGVLSLFVSYLAMLYTPLNFFADFFSDLARGTNAIQRLFEILETPPEVKESENPVSLSKVSGEITFDHVSFSYTPGKKAMDDISFHIPAGHRLGVVGHTGAGKSTLANLLTRLYDVSAGVITLDGHDLRDIRLSDLHRNVAIVSQETYLFRGTILDNIRYAAPDASLDDVLSASMAAGCHDFIMSFPDGYDTMVGIDKKLLSGGEKQRISIARAILKDPPVLILDEATAAMDTKTERRIQSALLALSRNRTTITIAHRLSTLRDADSLIVLEEGKLVEEGTHDGLLKKDGVYKKLYTLQMEALKTIGIEE